jgi:tRNA modification GTPase
VTVVFNKIDLVADDNGRGDQGIPGDAPPAAMSIRLSALTGEGFDALAAHLKACVGFEPEGAGALSARARHVDALAQVDAYLAATARLLAAHNAPELVAEELKRAQQALGDIVGVESSDELLGRIFARFCIGK